MKLTKETIMEWISVNKKIPKHNTDVLALHYSGQQYVVRFLESKIVKLRGIKMGILQPDTSLGHSWASKENHGSFIGGITHWMDLPELPEEN